MVFPVIYHLIYIRYVTGIYLEFVWHIPGILMLFLIQIHIYRACAVHVQRMKCTAHEIAGRGNAMI